MGIFHTGKALVGIVIRIVITARSYARKRVGNKRKQKIRKFGGDCFKSFLRIIEVINKQAIFFFRKLADGLYVSKILTVQTDRF